MLVLALVSLVLVGRVPMLFALLPLAVVFLVIFPLRLASLNRALADQGRLISSLRRELDANVAHIDELRSNLMSRFNRVESQSADLSEEIKSRLQGLAERQTELDADITRSHHSLLLLSKQTSQQIEDLAVSERRRVEAELRLWKDQQTL